MLANELRKRLEGYQIHAPTFAEYHSVSRYTLTDKERKEQLKYYLDDSLYYAKSNSKADPCLDFQRLDRVPKPGSSTHLNHYQSFKQVEYPHKAIQTIIPSAVLKPSTNETLKPILKKHNKENENRMHNAKRLSNSSTEVTSVLDSGAHKYGTRVYGRPLEGVPNEKFDIYYRSALADKCKIMFNKNYFQMPNSKF